MSTPVKIWVTILLLAVSGYAAYVGAKVYRAVNVSSTPASSFADPSPNVGQAQSVTWADVSKVTLIERSGEPLPLKQFEGQVWVVNFFFATCPGSCKTISAELSKITKELVDKDVTFVSISVDPETDTPERLREYGKTYNADEKKWLFATGDFELIRGLCSDIFKIPVERKTHADRLVLIDRNGQIAGTYHTKYPEHVAAMKRKIDKLLAAKAGDATATEPVESPAPPGSKETPKS